MGVAAMEKLKAVGSSSGATRVPVVITDCGVAHRGEAAPEADVGDKKKD